MKQQKIKLDAMDSIYSNKKYLQSLNAADYYRASTTLRPSVSRTLDYHRRPRFSLLQRNIVQLASTVSTRDLWNERASVSAAVSVLISVLINSVSLRETSEYHAIPPAAFEYLPACFMTKD